MAAALWLMPALPAAAQPLPDTVVLDALADQYEAVRFDHAGHIDMTESCAECHHHGTGAPVINENCARCHSDSKQVEVVGCASCHPLDPFSAEYLNQKDRDLNLYHRDKPGLKAAYHQNCLGCHDEVGGPVGCQDCHRRTLAGDAFFKAGSVAPTPKMDKGH
jgi:hypothetical protein